MILERLYKRMQRRLLQSIVSLSYDQLEDFVGRFRPPPPIYSSIFTREATGRLLTKLQTWLSHSVLATLYG